MSESRAEKLLEEYGKGYCRLIVLIFESMGEDYTREMLKGMRLTSDDIQELKKLTK